MLADGKQRERQADRQRRIKPTLCIHLSAATDSRRQRHPPTDTHCAFSNTHTTQQAKDLGKHEKPKLTEAST